MTENAMPAVPAPIWLRLSAIAGLLWSLFGAYLFAAQTFADRAGLMAQGMTADQAALYDGLPWWMGLAFGIGTLGGVIGCGLLLLARRAALAMLWVSLGAYAALYAGDIVHGVFEAFGPPQVIVLTVVVAIAAALVWVAQRAARSGALT